MRIATSTTLIVAVTVTLLAQAPRLGVDLPRYSSDYTPTTPITRRGHVDRKAAVVASVSREEILKSPRWAFTAEHPPLSPRKAEQLAAQKLAGMVKDPNLWLLTNIELTNAGDGEHWVYEVCFERGWHEFASMSPHPTLYFFVLMDGRVIVPKPETQ
jgi:hypothetical protein